MCSVIIIYWIWSCITSSTKYICNTTEIDRVYRNVDAAIQAAPVCNMRIQCYHYENHHFTEKDADGNTRHRTERRRVNTHFAQQRFAFTLAIDQSPPSSTLHYLDVMHLVRLRTYKNISYSPQAMASYEHQRMMFLFMHRRDVHYDYNYSEDVPYQADNVLAYNGSNGGKPWFTSCGTLFFLDMLFLGWIQRYTMLSKTGRVTYRLNKYIVY